MPYRRLPNTDNARIRALRTAIDKNRELSNRIISSDIIALEAMLRKFENAQIQYRESLHNQAKENQKLQKLIKNARLYISHFIQVFNLAVIRHEIKKETKDLYNLEIENHTVPDLSNNEALIQWGENIINGEQIRTRQGGVPIYNPSIARVNVAYSLFKNAYLAQQIHQATTIRLLEALSCQREDIDSQLTTIWNEIEAHFSNLEPNEKLEKCKEYGVVYYLRKGEREYSENDN